MSEHAPDGAKGIDGRMTTDPTERRALKMCRPAETLADVKAALFQLSAIEPTPKWSDEDREMWERGRALIRKYLNE